MAATRLIALHQHKGRTVAQSLGERTDYAKNPEKTEKGETVTSFGCDPYTVDEEFMLQKRQYYQTTGKKQHSDVIAYQIRQSFKPGEITAEEANRVGYELALRFSWRCGLPRANTPLSWQRTQTGLISITTLSSIPLLWTARKNLRTSGAPAWRCRS